VFSVDFLGSVSTLTEIGRATPIRARCANSAGSSACDWSAAMRASSPLSGVTPSASTRAESRKLA
jgi:hypothetical protein